MQIRRDIDGTFLESQRTTETRDAQLLNVPMFQRLSAVTRVVLKSTFTSTIYHTVVVYRFPISSSSSSAVNISPRDPAAWIWYKNGKHVIFTVYVCEPRGRIIACDDRYIPDVTENHSISRFSISIARKRGYPKTSTFYRYL